MCSGSRTVVLNQRWFCPSVDICWCLKRFLVVTTGDGKAIQIYHWHLEGRGQRAESLNILQTQDSRSQWELSTHEYKLCQHVNSRAVWHQKTPNQLPLAWLLTAHIFTEERPHFNLHVSCSQTTRSLGGKQNRRPWWPYFVKITFYYEAL